MTYILQVVTLALNNIAIMALDSSYSNRLDEALISACR